MADRILVWYFPDGLAPGDNQGPTYELDADYAPVRFWVKARTSFVRASVPAFLVVATDVLSLDIDYEYEGTTTSIFTTPLPGLQNGSIVGERDYFADPRLMKQGGLVKFNVDEVGPNGSGTGFTVQLELVRV